MTAVGILPIKEHSQRVPGKNFRLLQSKQLYKWTLDALVGARICDAVVINTDCPDRFRGLLPPAVAQVRAPELLGDEVSMNRVIGQVVAEYPADYYIQVHASNPFVTADLLRSVAQAFESGLLRYYDSVFSVTEHYARFYQGNVAVNHDPDNLAQTQDLTPLYQENSSFYLFRRKAFCGSGRRLCGTMRGVVISRKSAWDIDTLEDWRMAERLA